MGKKNNKHSKNESNTGDSHVVLDFEFNQYMREISKKLENNDDENKVMLINNFIESIPEGQYEIVAQHGLGSKIIESLLGYSSPENFESLTSNLSSRKLFCDVKSTFVLESCIKIAVIRALADKKPEIKTDEEDEPMPKKKKFMKRTNDIEYNLLELDVKVAHSNYCNDLVIRLSKFVLNNIEDFLTSQGNHFVRTCLLSLSGIITIKSHDKSAINNHINLITSHQKIIKPEWIEILCDFSSRILEWPQFADLAFEEKSSTFLQILCQALHNTKQSDSLKKLIKAIMKKCFKEEEEAPETQNITFEMLKPFSNKSSQFLLEAIMQYCDEKLFEKIYTKYFKSFIVQMCDSNFNFTVQRLIDSVKSKEIFEEIFTATSPLFSNFLQNGRTGVVLAICKACDRLSFKQGQFIQSLLKSLECEKSPNFTILCISNLMPLKVMEQKTEIDVHLHGSLILQHILKFNKPIKIVQNMLDMKPQHLSDIFCHQKGSRIADAFLESKFIGEKSREKLVKHLEGMYLKMAMSRNGSHVLEKFYSISSDNQKENIVKELSERINQLTSSQSGKIVAYKFSVELYGRNSNQWRNLLSKNYSK